MFTVEIKINGSMIAHVYGRNYDTLPSGLTKYRYEYYQPENRALRTGFVEHDRSLGIVPLVKSILIDVEK